MKLSEAIRLSSLLGPQCHGRDDDGGDARCALAGALDASGVPWDCVAFFVAEETWPWLKTCGDCPVCFHGSDVTSVILHLNDDHKWTREQIAEWVQTVEPLEVRHDARGRESLPTLSQVDQRTAVSG